VNIKWRKVVSSSKEVATTVASISVNPLGGGAVIPSDPVKRRPAIIESIVRDVAADYNVTLKPSIVKDTLTLPSATYLHHIWRFIDDRVYIRPRIHICYNSSMKTGDIVSSKSTETHTEITLLPIEPCSI
jgi:hypothetical protein